MDETLDSIPLESTTQNTSISKVAHEELKHVAQDISLILKKNWKNIEG